MEQKQEEKQIPFINSSWIEKSNYLFSLGSGYLWRVKRTKDASDYPYTSIVNVGFPLSLLPMNIANLLSLPLIITTGLKSGMKRSKIFFLSLMMVCFYAIKTTQEISNL